MAHVAALQINRAVMCNVKGMSMLLRNTDSLVALSQSLLIRQKIHCQ